MAGTTATGGEREAGQEPGRQAAEALPTDVTGLGPHPGVGVATGPPEAGAVDASGPPGHLSPSSMATFTSCPRRWRFRYVERLPDPPGLAALAGTLVHRVLERLLAEPAEGRTVERARALAGEEWVDHALQPDLARFALDVGGTRAYKWRVWRSVNGLWDLEDPATVSVTATEQRLAVELAGVPFVGVVDRVDRRADGLVVTDYKSGRPPPVRHREERLDQVLLYAAAVAAAGGEAPTRARLLYLGAEVIEVGADPTARAAAVERLRACWQEVQSCLGRESFPARPGGLCPWCPYLERCPEGRREVRYRHEAGMVSMDAPGLRLVA
jgi:putative RecB family exonuclease